MRAGAVSVALNRKLVGAKATFNCGVVLIHELALHELYR